MEGWSGSGFEGGGGGGFRVLLVSEVFLPERWVVLLAFMVFRFVFLFLFLGVGGRDRGWSWFLV